MNFSVGCRFVLGFLTFSPVRAHVGSYSWTGGMNDILLVTFMRNGIWSFLVIHRAASSDKRPDLDPSSGQCHTPRVAHPLVGIYPRVRVSTSPVLGRLVKIQ